MEYKRCSDANVITEKLMDSILIEERLIDSVVADLTTAFLGEKFAMPVGFYSGVFPFGKI